jgi:ABC-type uncharacterized transport system substrate-binding protein
VRTRRAFITLVGGAVAWPLATRAQQVTMRVIGFVGGADPIGYAVLMEAFRSGLRDYGYVEGQNVRIEYRWAEGNYERLPGLAADLVSRNVDIIITQGTPAAFAAKQATTTIPIVMAVVGDPVDSGIVASYSRPGGNITGSSFFFKRIAELATRNRLPGVGFREYCEAGGLAAYGVNFPHIWRRAAVFVDKIFKGAKPADLPIEQATRFEFIMNLRTARSLGIDISSTLLAHADEVIE